MLWHYVIVLRKGILMRGRESWVGDQEWDMPGFTFVEFSSECLCQM